MLKYIHKINNESKEEWIETDLRGKALLNTFLLNKGTAFTHEERLNLELLGKLPPQVETIEAQAKRIYKQYSKYAHNLQKNIFLNNLRDKNEVLFYKVLEEHLVEMLPIIYTPTVAEAVKNFSNEFRQPRGLYISYADKDYIEQILNNRTHPNVDIVVVTDGQRVLGIGDQGIGGMDISIAKLMVYTSCGSINPYKTLPIMLDVGTDNEDLLNSDMYLGYRNKRIKGQEYYDFIDKFVNIFKKTFPNAILHWEDLGKDNARNILQKYQKQLCTFNDDMQGTAVVTISAILAAIKRKNEPLQQQKFAIFGAGTAGCAIADYIVEALMRAGVKEQEAYNKVFLIDSNGLIGKNTPNVLDYQLPYSKESSGLNLLETIRSFQPTVLIGCSAQQNTFNQAIVTEMLHYTGHPIILPLSNPNEKSEANPYDLLKWSNNKAIVATGSPFGEGITQCNNALCFPGIGLGVTVARPPFITSDILWQAVEVLSNYHVAHDNLVLPDIGEAVQIARAIAIKIVAFCGIQNAESEVDKMMWRPYYRQIKPISGEN